MRFEEKSNYITQHASEVLIKALEMAAVPDNICELVPDYSGRVTLQHIEGPAVSSLLDHKAQIKNSSILLLDGGVSFRQKRKPLERSSFGEFFTKPSHCDLVKMFYEVGITIIGDNAERVLYRFQVQFDALNLPLEEVQSLADDDADCMMFDREDRSKSVLPCTLL